jgi:sarcosine oxidase
MAAERFDVILAGLGAMGSATAYHLARRGRRVLGLDRYGPGHTLGSYHGESRIIRELYFENPTYVPLVQRAYELWRELEAQSRQTLLHETAGLMIGLPDGKLVSGARLSAETYGLPYEILTPVEVRRRWSAFSLPESFVALVDRRAGYLRPEACVAAHQGLARASGAVLHYEEPALRWSADGAGVRVATSRAEYLADRLVLSAGAYVRPLLAELDVPLTVERQTLFWFGMSPADTRYDASAFPIYILEIEDGSTCYGFPRLPRGLKAAVMHEGETVADPERVRRSVGDDEVQPLRRRLNRILPELAAAPVHESAVCLFTNTPDHHFLLDHHPEYPQVLISSPCSGHGFKFASAIGELQAQLLTEGSCRFDLAPFRLARFAGAQRS